VTVLFSPIKNEVKAEAKFYNIRRKGIFIPDSGDVSTVQKY
jgi:uncharacterized Fe-S cluster protein YjdI